MKLDERRTTLRTVPAHHSHVLCINIAFTHVSRRQDPRPQPCAFPPSFGHRSFQCRSYHVVHAEQTASVLPVNLPDNFAEHNGGQIMHWLAFDRELADRFSRELIAPESRPLKSVEDSRGGV